MHLGSVAFYRLAVVLHLVEGGWVAVAIDNLFTVFPARTRYHHLIGVDFDGALSHDNIAGKGHYIALHIERLRIGFDMNRLLGITRHSKRRHADGQQRAGNNNIKAEFVCLEFHRRF